MNRSKARFRKRFRDAFAGLPVEVVDVSAPPSGHTLRVTLRSHNGSKMILMASQTPSDRRADRNNRAEVKRWLRQLGECR